MVMKQVLSIIACLLLTMTAAWAEPSGNWTDEGNYASAYKDYSSSGGLISIHIENAAQLARLACQANYNGFNEGAVLVYLDADIDLSAHCWVPIQASQVLMLEFRGQDHKITGMTIHNQTMYAGLFGNAKNVTVEHLTISNAQIKAGSARYAGIIIANALDCCIHHCTVENSALTLESTDWSLSAYAGGLVGLGTFSKSLSYQFKSNKVLNTQLTDNSRYGAIGGLFGATQINYSSTTNPITISDCHSSVQMVSNNNFPDAYSASGIPAGGLIGMAGEGKNDTGMLTLKHCTSGGTLTMRGGTCCGGLVGINQDKANLAIEYGVSTMTIEGSTTRKCGGLLGYAKEGSSTDIKYSCSSSYIYCSNNEATLGGLIGCVSDETCNLTNCTYAGTIYGQMWCGGALIGFILESELSTMRANHRVNGLVYDRWLCNLPMVGYVSVTYDEDEMTGKTSKELASDDEPYNSLLKAPIDIKTAYSGTLCYEDNIMLAAIPFYVKDPLHNYYCAHQVTTVLELVPIAYNRATKKALGMYDVVKAPNGAGINTFLKVEEDAESAVKTITPLDPGEADVVVTYYNADTKKQSQRKVHLDVTYGVPYNNNEPTDFPGGNGAIDDPFLIQNASQLARVAADKEVYNRPDKYYRLANDIFINTSLIQTDETVKSGATVWTPLEWCANLDGNGKTIYGVYVHGNPVTFNIERDGDYSSHFIIEDLKSAGLFYLLSGYVHDLAIVDSYVSVTSNVSNSSLYIGLLCGMMTGNAKIERCMVHGILDSNKTSGGLVGYAVDIDTEASRLESRDADKPITIRCGTIEDCYGCVHVEYGLDYYHEHGTRKNRANAIASGIAGNGVKTINRCISTGKVENFSTCRGVSVKANGSDSDTDTWYYDKQQMRTTETTNTQGEHTTAEMIGGDIFAGNAAWQHEKGRYPILKQFANTPYGDLLSMPVLFADGDRAGSVTKVFEFPTDNVTWTAVNGDTYVDVINECGGASPMSTGSDYIYASTNESVSQCTKALRVMQVDCTVTGTVGIDFKDANCKAAWLTALGKENTDVVTLRNAVTVTENQAKAFNTAAQTNGVTAFPEMRFFTGIKVLKPGMLSNLNALTELELPRQLTDIGPEVFSGCSSLESVTIPATTTTIEAGVLDGSSIKDIYVDSYNPYFEVRDHALFTTDDDLYLMAYPPARGEQSITLHGPFHNIATHAFYQIPQLDEIYIDYPKPEGSVVQMDDEAIVHYNYDTNGQLMDIYINDGTYDGTQWTTTQYATGGNNDGILMKEYLGKPYWKDYADAGKLHRYFPLTVTTAKWATMYIGFCTKLPDDIKAYVMPEEVTSSSTSVTLKRINNRLHHTVPVVIYCETPGTYILSPEPGMSSADDVSMTANKLMGSDIGQEKTPGVPSYGTPVNQSGIQNEYSILTLSIGKTSGTVGFYGFTGTMIPPYKAYATCNWVGASSSSPSFGVIIDDTIDMTSAIQETAASLTFHPSHPGWYSLDGRRLSGQPTQRGIYVLNGQKIVVK